jgi:hypothetical protein
VKDIVVYVPAGATSFGIAPRSGIVGRPDGERLLVDYEGNVYGAQNLRRYADRLLQAHGRQQARYPTVARIWVERAAMRRVGSLDVAEGRVVLDDAQAEQAVAAWLGQSVLDPAELESDSAHHLRRREWRAAAASPDPALRHFARRELERLERRSR